MDKEALRKALDEFEDTCINAGAKREEIVKKLGAVRSDSLDDIGNRCFRAFEITKVEYKQIEAATLAAFREGYGRAQDEYANTCRAAWEKISPDVADPTVTSILKEYADNPVEGCDLLRALL